MSRELVGMSLSVQSWTASREAGQADVDPIVVRVPVKALRALLPADSLACTGSLQMESVEMWTAHRAECVVRCVSLEEQGTTIAGGKVWRSWLSVAKKAARLITCMMHSRYD